MNLSTRSRCEIFGKWKILKKSQFGVHFSKQEPYIQFESNLNKLEFSFQ